MSIIGYNPYSVLKKEKPSFQMFPIASTGRRDAVLKYNEAGSFSSTPSKGGAAFTSNLERVLILT
jgi:hypothetical protein